MKHLNEGLFEQDNWTYLIIEQNEHVNFFNNGYFSPNDYYKDDIDDNKFLLVNTNKNINSSSGQEFIKKQWKRKFETFPQSVRCILSSNGSIEHAKYIKKIAKAIDLGKVTLKDVMNICMEYDGHWENKVQYVYGKIFYISIKENKNIIKDMRKNNDRILLESLVKKYGKNGVKNAINELAKLTKRQWSKRFPVVRQEPWYHNELRDVHDGPELMGVEFQYVMDALSWGLAEKEFPGPYGKPWTGWYYISHTGDNVEGALLSSLGCWYYILRQLKKYNKDITVEDVEAYVKRNSELIDDYFKIA